MRSEFLQFKAIAAELAQDRIVNVQPVQVTANATLEREGQSRVGVEHTVGKGQTKNAKIQCSSYARDFQIDKKA